MSPPAIFISYSHDSQAHCEQVLRLAERLREDGLDAQLDQYVNGTPPEGWPRWMLDRLDEASFVLVVCTSTYYRRFRGHEVADRGKGADWEGASITQELYDAKRRTLKFVPVMFAGASEDFVPEPLRAQTHYMLTNEGAYQSLYAFLRGVAGVGARPVGELKPLARDTVEPLRFADAEDPSADPSGPGASRRKSAWTARIVVAAVLVLGGAFLVRRVDWSRSSREEPAPESAPQVAAPDVSVQLKAAQQALQSKDYEGAWHSAGEAVTRAPQSEQARDTQCAVAMAWIRDMHVAPPMKFSDTVDLLLPCLTERAATTEGAAGADVVAHIGWAYFLKWRDGERQLDVDGSYRRALTLDPANPFAHAMWGHWILWQHGSLAEARAHFAAALKSKREREFVRGLEIAGLQVEAQNPEHVVELVHVWNDMRKVNEPLSAEDRSDAVADTYWGNRVIVEERLDSILPAQDHLATFAWLNDPASERNAATHAYWTARLTETAGDTARALPLYLVALTMPSLFERAIRDGIARCQGSGGGAIRLLVQSLTDADATVRATAARSIAALPADAPSVTGALLTAVRDVDPGVRANAAHALGAIGADPSVAAPALAQALRDPVDAVRNSAAESLIALGEPAVPSLFGLLRDPDARVRRSAAGVIGEIAPKSDAAVEGLVGLLRDPDAETRAAAASALGAIGADAKSAVPALVELLRGERDGDVRASVVIALGEIGPDASSAVPELREELTRALADPTDGGGYRGSVIAEALGNIGPSAEPAVDVLERALESDHLRVPNAAAAALGKIGAAAKRSIPALLDLMARTDSEYRDNQAEPLAQIAVALAHAGDAQAVDSLKRVLRALQTAEAKPERIADVTDAIGTLQAKPGQ